MIQDVLTYSIIAVAFLYVAYKLYKTVYSSSVKSQPSCSDKGCAGCSIKETCKG